MSDTDLKPRAFGAFYILVILAVLGAGIAAFKEPDPYPLLDSSAPATALTNARLVTPSGAIKGKNTLVIQGQTIVAILDSDELAGLDRDDLAVVDMEGAAIIPGLRDAHAHLQNLGERASNLDLSEAEDLYDLCARVESHLVLYKGSWLWARGWDQSTWKRDKTLPSSTEPLDAVTNRPVFLKRVDGHAAYVNKRALEAAGITADTPNPPGGEIVRDASGRATGMLIDTAMGLVTRHIPGELLGGVERNLRLGLNLAAKEGLVAVHDAGMSREELDGLLKIAREGPLPVRVYVMISSKDQQFFDEQMARGPRIGLFNDHVTIRATKLYQDGAMGSRGAALLEPYTDLPQARGLLTTPPERSEALTKAAAKAGFQVCTHAIGDRANRIVLDHFAAAFPGDDDYQRLRKARFRVEHAQVLHPADLDRFAEMGVIASMQPTHQTTDMRWVENRLGADRLMGAYAWRTLLDSGARLAFGSDFPVEPVDPRRGLYSAITRRDPKTFQPEGGWRAQEALTGGEALAGFTEWAAFSAFEEKERGQLKVGQKADLTILSDDPVKLAETAPEKIMSLEVLATYVNGRKVTPLALSSGNNKP